MSVEPDNTDRVGTRVGYDARALTIDSKRVLLLSGSIHYPRSTPAMWPELMRRSQEAGLNAIDTYAFWNLHESRRGAYDFAGPLDLMRFCELAREQGLWVILRIGPYVCAETNYGGFPAWLRDVPGMQMRTDNEPFKREMERWVRMLCHHLRPMFATNGGPIIAAQIENEYALVARQYGEAGERYLQWAAELGRSLDLGVPLLMCEGAAGGAIETINGFFAHDRIEKHKAAHPDQPTLWTEHWPGWYDTWGMPAHDRPPQTVAYGVARFFAAGGTGVNYYMWHGGTNFGRQGMFLQATQYFACAPLDEFGFETTRSNHLAQLHGILQEYAELLLSDGPPHMTHLGEKQPRFTWGGGSGPTLSFYCNDSVDEDATVEADGAIYHLPPRSVTLVSGERVLMNTAQIESSSVIQRSMRPVDKALSKFLTWPEPLPPDWPEAATHGEVETDEPIEQLRITEDRTDYCWYSTTLHVDATQAREGMLTIEGVADIVHVFLNGVMVGRTKTPLPEERGPIDGEGFKQAYPLKLRPLVNRLSFLCGSLGLIKGDWMIGNQNMADEKKGMWGRLLWNGQPIKTQAWSMQPGLLGERYQLHSTAGELAPWKPATRATTGKPLHWYRTTFDRPKEDEANAPLALDLAEMNKGMAWLNGECIGRYWLIEGTTEERRQNVLDGGVTAVPGEPTQRYYHLPAQWLRARNTLVLFEEIGGDPAGIKLCRWR